MCRLQTAGRDYKQTGVHELKEMYRFCKSKIYAGMDQCKLPSRLLQVKIRTVPNASRIKRAVFKRQYNDIKVRLGIKTFPTCTAKTVRAFRN